MQYTSEEQVFNGLSQGFLKVVRAGTGVETEVQASRTVPKICCKSFSEYLGTSVATAESFSPGCSAAYLGNSDLRDGRESRRAKEDRSWQRQFWSQTEVILVLTFL